jgi:hypothetical protein
VRGNAKGAVVIELSAVAAAACERQRRSTTAARSGGRAGSPCRQRPRAIHSCLVPRKGNALRIGGVRGIPRSPWIRAPCDVEFGVVGAKGYSLVIEQTLDNPYVIYEDAYTDRLVLHSATKEAIDEALLKILQSFSRMIGLPRRPTSSTFRRGVGDGYEGAP